MINDVGKYRKLYVRLWRHPGFVSLTDAEKTLALYLLTGPQTNRIGLSVLSVATAAEDLGTIPRTLTRRLEKVCKTFGWCFHAGTRVIHIPSWWRWNEPANVNVMRGNLKDLHEVPPSPLVDAFASNVEYIPDVQDKSGATVLGTFLEGLAGRLPERSPNQKQYQYRKAEAGEGARETPTAKLPEPARLNSGVLAGSLPRDHVSHAACDPTFSRCVPAAVHDKLADRLAPKHGGDRQAAKQALQEWYPSVWASVPADHVMGDAFKFWQGRFDARFASKDTPAAIRGPVTVCQHRHSPPCQDAAACSRLYLADLQRSSAPLGEARV